jgi:hypothetical protein
VYACPPYGRARRCGFGGWGVTNGIRADPRGCAYGSVCRHRAHDAYGRALRGKVPGHLLESVCGHMHAHVGLGSGTRHGVFVDTGQVSWTDEDVGSLRG